MRKLFIFLLLTLSYSISAFCQVDENDSLNLVDNQNRKQGTWREDYSGGALKRETMFKDGKKNGLDLTFYRFPNCLKEETQYRNDTLNGYRIEYFRNCRIKLVENFTNGTQDGYRRTYHMNGELATEGLFKNGTLDGTIKVFNEKGDLRFETTSTETDADLEEYADGDIPITDSVILKMMSRIPFTSNTLVVADVTGSMYPYIGQLLLWYKINLGKTGVNHFAFFNDGNDRRDATKRVGETGGIYYSNPGHLGDLKKVMETAIKKGGGGDIQENDLEGVSKGIKKFRGTDRVILIADRMSPVRDMSLLKRINVPVDIILCGSPRFTNVHYLDIAYKTKGNLYSLETELRGISGLREGQRVSLGSLVYEFKNGRFRRIVENNRDLN